MWKMKTELNKDVCLSLNTKGYKTASCSFLQWLLDLVNLLLIHMICPAIMKNTKGLKMELKYHPDDTIASYAYWQLQGSI